MHQNADANQMNESNLAIVFGPNLLRPQAAPVRKRHSGRMKPGAKETRTQKKSGKVLPHCFQGGSSGLAEMYDAGKVISLMRLIIQNYDYFFGPAAAPLTVEP